MTSPYDDVILATSGLVAYWPLDEASGTTANDAVGSNDGTLQNTPTLGVAITPITAGDVGMTFASASSEHVTVPDNAAWHWGTGDWSVEMWLKRNGDPSGDEYLISQGSPGSGGTGFHWQFDGGGGSFMESQIDTVAIVSAGTSITDDAWHHAVVTHDRDGNGNWYVDGSAANLSGTPTNISSKSAYNVTNTGTLYIARRGLGNYWNGGIAKVALYNVALSAATVSAHYAARTATASASAKLGLLLGIG